MELPKTIDGTLEYPLTAPPDTVERMVNRVMDRRGPQFPHTMSTGVRVMLAQIAANNPHNRDVRLSRPSWRGWCLTCAVALVLLAAAFLTGNHQ